MSISIPRETILKPLQAVIGVVERRQTLPILSNVVLSIKDKLSFTATDLEVELKASAELEHPLAEAIAITVPGRKFMDICRSLPDQSMIEITQEKDRIIVRSGRSRFSLATLPVADFPSVKVSEGAAEFTVNQKYLRYLTLRTHFAMAQQDVRYYLNGMLLEVHDGSVRAVATDGHRLALNSVTVPAINSEFAQVIMPRKGVLELMRLLEDTENDVSVQISSNHIRVNGADFTFISKLVDGRFPDYEKVLPRGGNKTIILDREVFKQALTRASILSSEKFRGVRLQLRSGLLRIMANNPEQEEAEEEISIAYTQEDLEIGFNVTYILDILATMETPMVKLTFSDANSSALLEEHDESGGKVGKGLFVIMPMRL